MYSIYSHMSTLTHTHTQSDLCDAGAGESDYDGHNVDSELELEELGDAVVDVPAPHHRLHDAAEVVVGQDDIWRFLGDICTSKTLEEQSGATTGFCYTFRWFWNPPHMVPQYTREKNCKKYVEINSAATGQTRESALMMDNDDAGELGRQCVLVVWWQEEQYSWEEQDTLPDW